MQGWNGSKGIVVATSALSLSRGGPCGLLSRSDSRFNLIVRAAVPQMDCKWQSVEADRPVRTLLHRSRVWQESRGEVTVACPGSGREGCEKRSDTDMHMKVVCCGLDMGYLVEKADPKALP